MQPHKLCADDRKDLSIGEPSNCTRGVSILEGTSRMESRLAGRAIVEWFGWTNEGERAGGRENVDEARMDPVDGNQNTMRDRRGFLWSPTHRAALAYSSTILNNCPPIQTPPK